MPPLALVTAWLAGALQELPEKFVHIEPPCQVNSPVMVSVAGPKTTPAVWFKGPVMVVVPALTKSRTPPLKSSVPALFVILPVKTKVPDRNCRLPPDVTVHVPGQDEPQSPPPRKMRLPLPAWTDPVLLN